MRAISTVLDVSLCLLLVTASALTLVGTPTSTEPYPNIAQSDPDTADETIDVLTTATARVTYSVGDQNRTIHDTLAGLLADAVFVETALSDVDANATTDFRQGVTATVGRALHRSNGGVQILADCKGCDIGLSSRRVAIGEQPPPKADVHAATLSIPGEHPDRQVRLTVRTWSR